MRDTNGFIKAMRVKMEGELAGIDALHLQAERAEDEKAEDELIAMAEKKARESLGCLFAMQKAAEFLIDNMAERGAMMEFAKEWEERLKRIIPVEMPV